MSYKATKPGLALSVVYLSIFYCIVYYGPFYVLLFFIAVFCLLVVLVELSVLAKWLARKNPLKKPNHGEGIVSRKPRPKSVHDFLGLLYCFIILLCISVVFSPFVIYYPTVMARYSLFLLKVPLNPKQTNKQRKLNPDLLGASPSPLLLSHGCFLTEHTAVCNYCLEYCVWCMLATLWLF